MEISKPVLKFAERMQYKLDKNKHKSCTKMNPKGTGRGWEDCDIPWLIYKAKQELKELDGAYADYNFAITLDGYDDKEILRRTNEVLNECADVANFAMMIFDNITERSDKGEE